MDRYRKVKKENMQEIPWGKETLGALDTPLNELEKKALQNLDVDKLNDMAECLFALNNRHYGPIPGTYMVMCIEPNKTWCVGQLSADRAKPFVLFPDLVFNSVKEATEAAEALKAEKAEGVPCRNI
jgi:hypothetical protein|tara:strand:- start:9 stop:386 length:378 start_codon:yes stop_codon:yes gene_type:complete